MENNIINPFKNKTNWAKKAENRLKKNNIEIKENSKNISINKNKKEKVKRVAKSFKVYFGPITRNFDKRVNKLQVYFDDLDYDKNYVDSGKYIMFLMQFAEKFKIYELYKNVDHQGNLDLKLDEIKKFIEKL